MDNEHYNCLEAMCTFKVLGNHLVWIGKLSISRGNNKIMQKYLQTNYIRRIYTFRRRQDWKTVIGGITPQTANNAENVSIWWRPHVVKDSNIIST